MKKILLVALMALCGASFGFGGSFDDCVGDCKQNDRKCIGDCVKKATAAGAEESTTPRKNPEKPTKADRDDDVYHEGVYHR